LLCPIVVASEKFIAVGDIHFDPFWDCKLGGSTSCEQLLNQLKNEDVNNWNKLFQNSSLPSYHQNSNYALLQSTFNELNKIQNTEHPQFVIVMGDLLSHFIKSDYDKYSSDKSTLGYTNFVKKTIMFIAKEMRKNLPNTNIYFVVGNNDSYAGDYAIQPKGDFFKDMASILSPMINDENNRSAFNNDFPECGYYLINMPNTATKIIVLNSVIFTSYPNPTGLDNKNAANREFEWLNHQLDIAESNGQKVMIIDHVPFGVDSFLTVFDPTNPLKLIKTFWLDEYNQKIKTILANHASVITGIISAHIHKDSYQALPINEKKAIPIFYTPAVSPIYQNNPGFKIYEFDPISFILMDYDVYYLDLASKEPEWKNEYDFNQIYQSGCVNCSLLAGIENDNLLSPVNFMNFIKEKKYFTLQANPPELVGHDADYFVCGEDKFTYNDYDVCLKSKK
jgi:hypothetical protein